MLVFFFFPIDVGYQPSIESWVVNLELRFYNGSTGCLLKKNFTCRIADTGNKTIELINIINGIGKTKSGYWLEVAGPSVSPIGWTIDPYNEWWVQNSQAICIYALEQAWIEKVPPIIPTSGDLIKLLVLVL